MVKSLTSKREIRVFVTGVVVGGATVFSATVLLVYFTSPSAHTIWRTLAAILMVVLLFLLWAPYAREIYEIVTGRRDRQV